MKRYGLCLLTLAATLLSAGTAVAGTSHFHTQFANDSAVLVEAVILHSNGTRQKSRNVLPGKKEKFHFGLKCRETHTRKFEVYEQQNGTLIGSGSFVMETGREIDVENECVYRRFDLTCDADPAPSDDFELSCAKVDEDLVRIRIEKP
jgi:hypothetical protein